MTKSLNVFRVGAGVLAMGFASLCGAAHAAVAPETISQVVDRQLFERLFDDPERFTQLGLNDGTWLDFHSGKLGDESWAHMEAERQRTANALAEIKAFDPATLSGQDKVTYEVMTWLLDTQLRFKAVPWVFGTTAYPVNQTFGEQSGYPRFMQSGHVVKNEKTAKNYVARLNAVGVKFDQLIDTLKHQGELGGLPPTFVFERVIKEMEAFAATPAKENQLYTDFVAKLAKLDLPQAEKDQLAAAAEKAIADTVDPAYQRLTAEVKALLPMTKPDAGAWARPQGDEFYGLALRQMTTTEMTPEQVHQVGLSEIDRINKEAEPLLVAAGMTTGTVGERLKALGEDPRYQWPDSDEGRTQILAEYQRLADQMETMLPQDFATLPPQKLEVVRVPPFAEAGAAGAYYNRPAQDGSRPGRVNVNLRNIHETPKWAMKTLIYHEGIPGHHFQISSAMNLKLPLARTNLPFTAYTEGWALYAERLASEMGAYKDDPLGDLGRLQAELFRATRLVVDTGMHFKRWTREQAIDFMIKSTGMADTDVTAEIERYVVQPAQACAYKIGMLKILELRERAKAALGDKFDLKAFHSVVLGNGPLPLTVLETVVDDWIKQQKGG